MKVKDLRIGNYITGVYYDSDTDLNTGEDIDVEKESFCEVLSLDITDANEYSIMVESDSNREYFNEFKGIPIAEAELLKLGFEFGSKTFANYQHPDAPLYFYPHPNGKGDYICFVHSFSNMHIKFIHQLQNIYFALTGKELTYNQPDK